MGWFSKKKEKSEDSSVSFDHKALRIPSTAPPDKVIMPEEIKKAAGVDKKVPHPPRKTFKEKERKKSITRPVLSFSEDKNEPIYIKVDIYQRILGELASLKSNLHDLSETSHALEVSEYNEETNFEKLKKNIKILHDHLLEVDQILFKG